MNNNLIERFPFILTIISFLFSMSENHEYISEWSCNWTSCVMLLPSYNNDLCTMLYRSNFLWISWREDRQGTLFVCILEKRRRETKSCTFSTWWWLLGLNDHFQGGKLKRREKWCWSPFCYDNHTVSSYKNFLIQEREKKDSDSEFRRQILSLINGGSNNMDS